MVNLHYDTEFIILHGDVPTIISPSFLLFSISLLMMINRLLSDFKNESYQVCLIIYIFSHFITQFCLKNNPHNGIPVPN